MSTEVVYLYKHRGLICHEIELVRNKGSGQIGNYSKVKNRGYLEGRAFRLLQNSYSRLYPNLENFLINYELYMDLYMDAEKGGEAKMETNKRLTMTLLEFASLSGISKNLAYSLAKQDCLGVKIIRLGKRMLLSRKAALDLLNGNSDKSKGS